LFFKVVDNMIMLNYTTLNLDIINNQIITNLVGIDQVLWKSDKMKRWEYEWSIFKNEISILWSK